MYAAISKMSEKRDVTMPDWDELDGFEQLAWHIESVKMIIDGTNKVRLVKALAEVVKER